MKLRIAFLPLLVIALFGYTASVLQRAHTGIHVTRAAVIAVVKGDEAHLKQAFAHPVPVDYSKLNN